MTTTQPPTSSPTGPPTAADVLTVLKLLLSSHAIEGSKTTFIVEATGLAEVDVRAIADRYGYPDLHRIRWAVDEMEKPGLTLTAPRPRPPRTSPPAGISPISTELLLTAVRAVLSVLGERSWRLAYRDDAAEESSSAPWEFVGVRWPPSAELVDGIAAAICGSVPGAAGSFDQDPEMWRYKARHALAALRPDCGVADGQ